MTGLPEAEDIPPPEVEATQLSMVQWLIVALNAA